MAKKCVLIIMFSHLETLLTTKNLPLCKDDCQFKPIIGGCLQTFAWQNIVCLFIFRLTEYKNRAGFYLMQVFESPIPNIASCLVNIHGLNEKQKDFGYWTELLI